MVFKSRVNGWIPFFVMGKSALVIVLVIFNSIYKKSNITPLLILLLMVLFLVWVFFTTKYKIANKKLTYKSGFLKGSIDILKINEIVEGKTLWIGIKPATATKGLILKFNSYDEIYISPNNNQNFIKELLKINPNIKITKP